MVGGYILGKRVRHLSRYKNIVQILVANGFGWFIDEIGLADVLDYPRRLFSERTERQSFTTYERVRRVLEDLGPTFVKLGQVASLRADVFPSGLIEQLTRLQDEVPTIPFATVKAMIEDRFGCSMDDVYTEFDEEPVGSASIGQVHRARLKTGEEVAVKVQRPDISTKIQVDLEILMDVARMAERKFDWAKHYALSDVVEELRYTLMTELDYSIEGRNADKLRKVHEEDQDIRIPTVFWDWTNSQILTMEYVRGIKLTNRKVLEEGGYDAKLIGERVANAIFSQMLLHGFFHADPHPGNVAVLPNHEILFMDFGMMGTLTGDMKRYMSSLIVGLMRRDSDAIIRTLYRMSVVPADIDELKFRRDVDGIREKYYDMPFQEIKLGDAVGELFSVAYRHRIKIPSDLTLVGKTLMTVESVVESLDPDFRILNVAEPFGRKLFLEQLNPKRFSKLTLNNVLDLWDMVNEFPKQVRSVMTEIAQGRFRVHLELSEVSRLVDQLVNIGNRLSFSILLLAFSIFMAGLLIASALAKSPSVLWATPLTDIGAGIGIVLLFMLIFSIWRSNR